MSERSRLKFALAVPSARQSHSEGYSMQMVYNSENFAVVEFDVPPEDAGSPAAARTPRGGYEIVDKFARKEIFIDGALAASFKQGVAALIDKASSEEEFDAWLGRYAALMQQPLTAH